MWTRSPVLENPPIPNYPLLRSGYVPVLRKDASDDRSMFFFRWPQHFFMKTDVFKKVLETKANLKEFRFVEKKSW